MKKNQKALIVLLTLCHCLYLSANNSYNSEKDIYRKVDSIMSLMTLDEKIGQLFMVIAYSNKSTDHKKDISRLIKKYKIELRKM